MGRNITGTHLPLHSTFCRETIEIAGSHIVSGIRHKNFFGFRIHSQTVRYLYLLFRSVRNETVWQDFFLPGIIERIPDFIFPDT